MMSGTFGIKYSLEHHHRLLALKGLKRFPLSPERAKAPSLGTALRKRVAPTTMLNETTSPTCAKERALKGRELSPLQGCESVE